MLLYDHLIFSSQRYGGISRYFSELIPRVVATAARYNPILYVPYYINEYLEVESYVVGSRIDDNRGTRKFRHWLNEIATFQFYFKNRPRVVHQTYFRNKNVYRKSKIVQTLYDMIPERYPDYFPGARSLIELKRKSLAYADHIICISENTKTDLLQWYPQYADRVSVIHLASGTSCTPEEMQNKSLPKKPYLLYVGPRAGYKNFKLLVEALGTSKLHHSLSVTCFGGGHFTAEEKDMFAKAKIDAHYAGHDDRHLRVLYHQAVAYVCTSDYEGFGIPILEAMQCGCPVVCAQSSSLPEVGGDAPLYFTPGDAQSLASVIQELGSMEKRESLIQSGRTRALKFSWDQNTAETIKVYQRLF